MRSRNVWITIIALGALALITYKVSRNHEENPSHMAAQTHEKSVWKLFKPQNSRFEVLLPSIPQHVAEAHPNGNDFTKYDVYLSQDKDGNVFMISLTEYPPQYEMGSVDDVLEAVKNGALGANSKNQIKNVEKSTYLNLPSMDFFIESSDSAIRSKAIVDNKTLIVLTAMNRDPARLEKDYNTFVGSFVLKPQGNAVHTQTHEETHPNQEPEIHR